MTGIASLVCRAGPVAAAGRYPPSGAWPSGFGIGVRRGSDPLAAGAVPCPRPPLPRWFRAAHEGAVPREPRRPARPGLIIHGAKLRGREIAHASVPVGSDQHAARRENVQVGQRLPHRQPRVQRVQPIQVAPAAVQRRRPLTAAAVAEPDTTVSKHAAKRCSGDRPVRRLSGARRRSGRLAAEDARDLYSRSPGRCRAVSLASCRRAGPTARPMPSAAVRTAGTSRSVFSPLAHPVTETAATARPDLSRTGAATPAEES